MIYEQLDAPEDAQGSLQLQMDTLKCTPVLHFPAPNQRQLCGSSSGHFRKVSWLGADLGKMKRELLQHEAGQGPLHVPCLASTAQHLARLWEHPGQRQGLSLSAGSSLPSSLQKYFEETWSCEGCYMLQDRGASRTHTHTWGVTS